MSLRTPMCVCLMVVGAAPWVAFARGEMCLNGDWRFMPAVGPAAQAPSADWGTLPVPGSWSGTSGLPGPTQTLQTGPWAVGKLAEVTRGWYEFDVDVPATWAGQAVVLDVTRVSTDAVVFANGVECGSIAWPRGEVELTRAVQPGKKATIRLLVVATLEAEDVTVYMGTGNDQTWTQPARLASRGIIGEVFLRSRPVGTHVAGLFVQPSVRRKSLGIAIELVGVRAGDATFEARLLGGQGIVERRFEQPANLTAGQQSVWLDFPWDNPRLWDLGRPELYTLELQARGAGLDDTVQQVFGFREFWIDGLDFYLNGTPIRLRPINVRDQWNQAAWVPAAIEQTLRGYAAAGFNLGEHWPNDEEERGSVYLRELWAEAADRQGFLLAGCALSMNGAIYDSRWRYTWEDEGVQDRYRARLDADLRRLRNHPSIVMWATSANFFGRGQDQHPEVIGRRGWYEHDQKARAGLAGVAVIKSVDPTRPVFTHHGADIGDLHTCNNYLDLIPLQEREEWLSSYAAHGEIPYCPIEFGTPLHCTLMRNRNGFGNNIVSEPLLTEFCAIYLGADAYTKETDAYRQRLQKTYEGGDRWRNWQNAPEFDQAPAFQDLLELFVTNTWRSWRTWGITAGMVPWSMAHGWAVDPQQQYVPVSIAPRPDRRGVHLPQLRKPDLHYLAPEGGWVTYPSGQALVANNSATLAWLAGAEPAFTAKDHLFESGSELTKQLVLINDQRERQPYRASWAVEVGGAQVGGATVEGQIAPAQILKLPIAVALPAAAGDGTITLAASIGERQHTDRFIFRVLPAVGPGPSQTVLAYDPEGATTGLLRAVGIAVQPWDGRPADGRVLAIGRRALSGGPLPGSIEAHVAAGGRLVIFGQDPDYLRRTMGWRVARHVSRRFFPVAGMTSHPVLAGFSAEDFRDWTGAGTLVAETWGGLDESPNNPPPFGWHWGNRGSVSSGAIEKPHHSGWRPVLEGEFDLAYSPLMELRHGQGLAIWCQLDLEGRTAAEPVARRVAQRLVDYAATARPEPRRPTVYLGGRSGQVLLQRLGVEFTSVDQLPAVGLAVVGGDASVTRDDLLAFLNRGGRALLLPRADEGLLAELGPEQAYGGSLDVPDWIEAQGLGVSDLHLRGEVALRPVLASDGVQVGAGGLLARRQAGDGAAVMLQLTPDLLPVAERRYLRYTRWRLTRVMTQLLANLGASFALDPKSLTPDWKVGYEPISLAGEWRLKVERKLPAATDPTVRTQDPGIMAEAQSWSADDLDASSWLTMSLPGGWEDLPGVGDADGAFWLRRDVDVPNGWVGKPLVLQLGALDDRDVTWFNGRRIGETSGWNAARTYRIPAELVREGRNSIALRVFDEFGGGGMFGRPEELRLGPEAPVFQPAGEELLANAGFVDGLAGWQLSQNGDAKATVAVTRETPGELLGQQSIRLDVQIPSETSWHISFGQKGLGIQAGVKYVWQAWVKASAPANLTAAIEKDHPPYGTAGLFQRLSVSPEWQQIRIEFTPEATDPQVRFTLQELASNPVTYWFAGASFQIAATATATDEPPDPAAIGLYHPDWIDDPATGDDPYRYYRW